MPTDYMKKWLDACRQVSEKHDADLYVLTGGLFEPADERMGALVKNNQKRKNVLLLLTTYGGKADVAYKIGRCLHRAYDKFTVYILDVCKSAGTLLAIGADKLIMGDRAQLGPLDVQLAKPDALFESISGLLPVHALNFLQEHSFKFFEYCTLELIGRSGQQITTKTAADIAARLAVGMFQPVYGHLDPLGLGEYHRDMLVASEYGKRLNRNLQSQNQLRRLTHDYPSHGFVIDREEAKEIFRQVEEPCSGELEIERYIWPVIENLKKRSEATISYIDVTAQLEPDPCAEAGADISGGEEVTTGNTAQEVNAGAEDGAAGTAGESDGTQESEVNADEQPPTHDPASPSTGTTQTGPEGDSDA